MQTIDQKLQLHKGLGPGFDFLRIGLAVSIVAFHAIGITGHNEAVKYFWFAEYSFVPMFFALSGFLVTGSAMRLSLKNFLINRSLRILPALAVDIVVCSLIIGPLVTTAPLAQYFTSVDFFKYFWNITGWIHYELPGVFTRNPTSTVNGALWTVPFEMLCYLMMSILILSRGVHKPAGVAVFIFFILFVRALLDHFHAPVISVHHVMSFASPVSLLSFVFATVGTRLLITFLLGIFVFQLKHRIPYSWPLFIGCCVLCLVEALVHDRTLITRLLSNDFVLLPVIVYITCFLGVTAIPVPKFVHSGDYSYGIYLYHSPFLQIVVSFLPRLAAKHIGIPIVFVLGLAIVSAVATCSWHFVEKPILGLRKRFSFVARVRGVASQADASVAPQLPDDPESKEKPIDLPGSPQAAPSL